MNRVYIATPMSPERREPAIKLAEELRKVGIEVYAPWEHPIEHAWDWPNDEWGLMVFENDITGIRNADWVVVLSWGRLGTTQGTAWEQGFAFGIGKKVLFVEMDDTIQSLMAANGRYATLKWNDTKPVVEYLLEAFSNPEAAPKLRTKTEQK